MIVYSQKLAAQLMLRGFILHDIGKNKKYKNKNIFYFKDSIEIKEAINELTK